MPKGRRRMNEIGKRIVDKLIEIHGSDDFRIAFLPYKRSMWDSMQSVYSESFRLKKEPYIIPLPYYRIIDGHVDSIDKDIFENAYDEDVLDEVRFDYVVIHYPYDDRNKVTRMLEKYHTAQLCKYGKVVYIPYSCSSMRMLRVQPGLANIDYAFLSSEADADAFISEWKEYGVDFTGRVFGYGSPKMDAIQKCVHEGDTKTALIVNSLGAFLLNPYGKLEQYRLAIIEQMAAGYSVIFRPHPLLRQTIRSMRPDVESNYIQFIAWAKTVGCFVDETEYLERALTEADILISDPSSIVEMWRSTERECTVL